MPTFEFQIADWGLRIAILYPSFKLNKKSTLKNPECFMYNNEFAY